ncbi:hypothetical protein GA0115240_102010 [Streptomyces sp. DvalAA-14]|uniref:hypothetical protein n=1 Tax=unclassified Streptomyces TaxID=2593676 RepID=UPI00081B72D5|nr:MULTISPECIES: hypothetical protein [unclassified Streptomyces]MYS18939.1 hypothetical protein [Streptomyces sp. SID4948]SCD32254.1 hypothetical protein GA0115240_102010 [Streptomyces sp. DvalAA-14]
MTTDSSPAPEGEPSLPDEVWDQFLRDTESDIRASAPKEPSARARIVARRLREEEARLAEESRRRPGRRSGRPGAPRAWRSGTTDAAEDRQRRRSRLRGMAAVVLVVVLLLIVLAPGRAWSFIRGDGWHDGAPGPAPTSVQPQPGPGHTIRT